MENQIEALQSSTGLSLSQRDSYEVSPWIPALFGQAHGRYVGFDTTLPSQYSHRLDSFIRQLDQYPPGVRFRVITARTKDLEEDFARHPEAINRLQEIHDAWAARLLFLDRDEVCSLAEKHRLPTSLADLALWEGDYCLLWEWGINRFSVRLCFSDDPTYIRVLSFIADVEQAAVPLMHMRKGEHT